MFLKDANNFTVNKASTLTTARTINGTSFSGSANITTANWGTARTLTVGNASKSVNGSANISWSLSEIGAAASNHTHSNYASTSHTHSSLTGTTGSTTAPSTGTGVMRYDYNVSSANAGTLPNSNNANGILTLNTHSGNYYNQLGFSGNGNLYYRAFNGKALDTTTAWKQIAFTDSNITGNAATATKLQTVRTINGTNFDGTSNITTANWGTARTITIGSTGKSVNGSGNVSWSLSEIGAAEASHTHKYAGSSSAGGSANAALKLVTARTINGTNFDGTGNITTANWGTARNIQIGNAVKPVNGSRNVSWTLDEMGAASRSPFSNTYKQITVGGDANTYYPVLITMDRPGIGYPWYNISISRAYNATAPDTWNTATHKGGLTFQFRWSGDNGWGGNDHNLQVVEFSESYTTMVAGFTLSVNGIVVWLRGGGALYQLNCEQGIGINATVTLGTYTAGDKQTYPVRTNTSSVAHEIHSLWVQRGGSVYDNNSRVYSPNNKPTPSEIGAAASSHTHNYLPLTGGTLSGNVVLNNDIAIGGKDTSGTTKWLAWVDRANNAQFGDVSIKSVINSNANPEVNVGGEGIYTLYHTGNKPTASDIGAFSSSGGTLTGGIHVPYESTFYNGTYTDPWNGQICSIKASGNVGIGGALKVNRNLKVSEYVHSPILEANTDIILNRYDFKTYYTNNELGSYIYCNKNNSYINLTDGKMTYANPNGNIEIGPQNSAHCHIYTDKPTFYFNKDLLVNGSKVYHAGNKPTPSEIGAAPALALANSYYGMVTNDGNSSNWIRTTQNGIIPYQSGGSSSLGTSGWPFNAVYATNFYGTLNGNATHWGGRQVWWGAAASRPGNGYIQFVW